MSHPHIPLDPRDADPLDVTYGQLVREAELEAAAFDEGYAAAVADRQVDIWVAAIAGAIVGAGIVLLVAVL